MADIVLTGNTSGAITIAAPAVAGTNTLTLPASTSTLATTADVNAAGKILQVLQETLTTSVSTTSTTYTNLITVAITPTATDSKIYVSFTTNAGTNGDSNHLYTSLFRDSTEIGSATSTGGRTGAQTVTNTGAQQQLNYAGALLDSPSSTSAITYAVKIKVSTGTGYWNRSARDTNNLSYDGRTVSQITVMEVGA
jgi:hypothetical protein